MDLCYSDPAHHILTAGNNLNDISDLSVDDVRPTGEMLVVPSDDEF